MANSNLREKRSFVIEWRIENFAHCSTREHDSIFSPLFVAEPIDNTDWHLLMYPKSSHSDDCELYLSRGYRGPEGILIDFDLSLLTLDESPVKVMERSEYFERNDLFGCPDFISHDELFSRDSIFLRQGTLTIRCRMRKQGSELEEEIELFAYSRIAIDRRFFTWKIPQFSSLELGESRTAKAPSIMGKKPIILQAFMEGTSLLEAFIQIKIGQDNPDRTGKLSCKISVVDRFGKVAKSKHDTYCLASLEGGYFWDFTNFVTRQELVDAARDHLPGDVLSLRCDLSTSFGIEYETISAIRYGPTTQYYAYDIIPHAGNRYSHRCFSEFLPLSILQRNLITMYEEQTLSDVELCTEERSFPAHKNILSVASPVFKAMFESQMKESTSSSVPISDIDGETLARFLTFIYGGPITGLHWEIAAKLYYAADKYEISSLKQKCASFLKSNLNLTNVYDTLVLADKHQDKDLKSVIYGFLLANGNDIFFSAKWKELMETNLKLSAETMHMMMKKLDFKMFKF